MQRKISLPVVDIKSVLQGNVLRRILIVSTAYHIEIEVAVIVGVKEQRVSIRMFLIKNGGVRFSEPAIRCLDVYLTGIALCAAGEHICSSVVIDIAWSHHWSACGEHGEQQRLALEVVISFLNMLIGYDRIDRL